VSDIAGASGRSANQLESQRCKYTLPLHKRFIDLRESRLGQQLKQERYNNKMRILM
jgi:hypothetical protein